MHLSVTNTKFYCAAKNAASTLSKKITASAKEIKTMRKVIPAAMVVMQSLGSLSANAPGLAASSKLMAYNKTANLTTAVKMAEKAIDNTKTISFTKAMENLKPKNKFTKNSFCIDQKYNGTPEELNYFIEQLLKKAKGSMKENPFYGRADSFIKIGQKYNINPTVMVAIGMIESGRGTSLAARKKFNIGGIDNAQGRRKFTSVEQCIEAMAQTLQSRYKENYKTIEQIGLSGRYCAKESGEQWVKNVMFFLNKM